MTRNEFYCQCQMQRPVEDKPNSYQTLVSWIPSDIAKVENKVRLRNSAKEEWSENWEILSAGEKKKGAFVEAKERDYQHQREASDA